MHPIFRFAVTLQISTYYVLRPSGPKAAENDAAGAGDGYGVTGVKYVLADAQWRTVSAKLQLALISSLRKLTWPQIKFTGHYPRCGVTRNQISILIDPLAWKKWNHEYDSISQANTLRLAALTMRNHSLSRRLRHYKAKLSKARLELAHSRREKAGINITRRRTGKLGDSRFQVQRKYADFICRAGAPILATSMKGLPESKHYQRTSYH